MDNPYDFELERIISEISSVKPKTVCLQMADGLKMYTHEVIDVLEDKFPDVTFIIWGGSNYGGCDLPVGLERLKVDLLVSFGHAPWVWGDELKKYSKY